MDLQEKLGRRNTAMNIFYSKKPINEELLSVTFRYIHIISPISNR